MVRRGLVAGRRLDAWRRGGPFLRVGRTGGSVSSSSTLCPRRGAMAMWPSVGNVGPPEPDAADETRIASIRAACWVGPPWGSQVGSKVITGVFNPVFNETIHHLLDSHCISTASCGVLTKAQMPVDVIQRHALVCGSSWRVPTSTGSWYGTT